MHGEIVLRRTEAALLGQRRLIWPPNHGMQLMCLLGTQIQLGRLAGASQGGNARSPRHAADAQSLGRLMSGNTIATMSGRQISFYMVEADELSFIDYLSDRWGASFLKRYSPQREPSCVPLPLSRPSDDASAHTLLIRIAGLEQGWVEKAMATTDGVERYAFLVPTNAAIEFSRSWQNDDGILVRGRLYLPLTEMKDRLLANDCRRLERAADSIWRWIRSRSTKPAGHWAWAFPGAAEALKAGRAKVKR